MEQQGPLVLVDWRRAAAALADEVARVTASLRSVSSPEAPALGQWSLTETAMHLSQVWILVPALAGEDLGAVYEILPQLENVAGASIISDLWDLGATTIAGVEADSERDPSVLAERIDLRCRDFLATLDAQLAATRHPWVVEGVVAAMTTLIGHLLSETIVHGYDIARADGRRWPISRVHAALALETFLLPVITALDPRTVVDQENARGLRATYELHLRGAGSHQFVFDDGALTIEQPGSRRVDCHISADPVALLLVGWGRRSQWPAIARGRIVAWGRKPWLGPRFRSLLRNP